MNVAIFGGTFDPIHRGHIEVARSAADQFDLKQVLFVPAGFPPHKPKPTEASYEHRYRMVALACEADSRFVPSRLEAPEDRRRRHYSVETVRRVASKLTSGERLFFILGSDAFAELTLWHRWREVVELAEFIVVRRPGRGSPQSEDAPGVRVHWLRTVDIPISSTEVRARLRSDKSVEEWIPPEVAHYIRKHDLYRAEPHGILQVDLP